MHPRLDGRFCRARLQIIEHRQDLFDDVAFHRDVRHLVIALDTLPVVLEFSLGAQPAILILRHFRFGLFELLFNVSISADSCSMLSGVCHSFSVGLADFFFVFVFLFIGHTFSLISDCSEPSHSRFYSPAMVSFTRSLNNACNKSYSWDRLRIRHSHRTQHAQCPCCHARERHNAPAPSNIDAIPPIRLRHQ